MFVWGVAIRVYHEGCGQYTQLRRREPKGEKIRCPKCGKKGAIWIIEGQRKINPCYFGVWWPTTPEEKMGLELSEMISEGCQTLEGGEE